MELAKFEAYRRAREAGDKAGASRIQGEIISGEEGLIERCIRKVGALGDHDDLRQAGRIGVMKAIEKFDPSRGAWAAYARQWVFAEMNRGVVDARPLVRGTSRWDKTIPKAVRHKARVIEAITGRPATGEELGLSDEKIEMLRGKVRDLVVPPKPRRGLDDDPLDRGGDQIRSSDQVRISEVLTKAVWKALGTLSAHEHRVFLAKVVEEMTWVEIAEEEGRKDERSVVEAFGSAIAKMRLALGVPSPETKSKAQSVAAKCHPDRKHVAGGLCRACYVRSRKVKGVESCIPVTSSVCIAESSAGTRVSGF